MGVQLPMISIRPNYIALYSLPETRYYISAAQKEARKHLKENKQKGLISNKAEKRIKNSIEWLLHLAKTKTFYHMKRKKNYHFKINFVTLTLASKQIHSDKEIKKELLNHFIVELKKKWKVKNYLWRAEAQKNGNIHFHIVTDVFIPWVELRNVWNRIQNKLGYVDRFKAKYKHRNPNSTDVHSIKNIRNISAYLAKYCTKNSDTRLIEGNIWGLSYSLSRIKSAIDFNSGSIWFEVQKIKESGFAKVVNGDYFTCLYVDVKEWAKLDCPSLLDLFNTYLNAYSEAKFSRGSPLPEIDYMKMYKRRLSNGI